MVVINFYYVEFGIVICEIALWEHPRWVIFRPFPMAKQRRVSHPESWWGANV